MVRIGRGWVNRNISLLRTAKICPVMPSARSEREIDHERRDLLRRHLLEALDPRLSSSVSAGIEPIMRRPGERRDAVRAHLEALHVERDPARQADDAELRRHVVGLAEIADQPRGRGHVHEGAGVLLAEMRRAGAAHVERAVRWTSITSGQSDRLMRWKIAVAQDAGVVDQDVDAAEGLERGLDDLPRRSSAPEIDSVEAIASPPALLDLVDDLLRRTGVGAGALQARADVAGDDLAPSCARPSAMPRPMPRPRR